MKENTNSQTAEPKEIACLRCRRKKAKCNKAKPKCSRCARGNYDCVYPDAPPTLSDLARQVLTLRDTLGRLESRFVSVEKGTALKTESVSVLSPTAQQLAEALNPKSQDVAGALDQLQDAVQELNKRALEYERANGSSLPDQRREPEKRPSVKPIMKVEAGTGTSLNSSSPSGFGILDESGEIGLPSSSLVPPNPASLLNEPTVKWALSYTTTGLRIVANVHNANDLRLIVENFRQLYIDDPITADDNLDSPSSSFYELAAPISPTSVSVASSRPNVDQVPPPYTVFGQQPLINIWKFGVAPPTEIHDVSSFLTAQLATQVLSFYFLHPCCFQFTHQLQPIIEPQAQHVSHTRFFQRHLSDALSRGRDLFDMNTSVPFTAKELSSRFLIVSLCAYASRRRFVFHTQRTPEVNAAAVKVGYVFYQHARLLLSELFTTLDSLESPDSHSQKDVVMDTVRGLVYLAWYCHSAKRIDGASTYTSLAVRLSVQILCDGSLKNAAGFAWSSDKNWLKDTLDEGTKRTWNAVVCLDFWIAFSMGKPSLIDDDFVGPLFIKSYVGDEKLTSPSLQFALCYTLFIRLLKQIMKTFYPPSILPRVPYTEFLAADILLSSWFSTLPPNLQSVPTSPFAGNTNLSAIITLHTLFHFARILVHRQLESLTQPLPLSNGTRILPTPMTKSPLQSPSLSPLPSPSPTASFSDDDELADASITAFQTLLQSAGAITALAELGLRSPQTQCYYSLDALYFAASVFTKVAHGTEDDFREFAKDELIRIIGIFKKISGTGQELVKEVITLVEEANMAGPW